MSRRKKDYKALNCLVYSNIWDRLDEHCKDIGTNKTFIVEKALQEYLDKCDKQKQLLEKHNIK